MRRTSLSLILALAMVAGACGSSDDDRPVDPSRISLAIVSGDRQTAPVADAPTVSGAAPVPGLSLQQLPDNLLPEPLVARIVVDGEPLKSRSSDPLGPSLATLPSDVVVTYRVIQPAGLTAGDKRHCGDSFTTSERPDKDGYVTTFWERGTLAGYECRMEVRLVVDGQPRIDTVFVAEFEPGPVSAASIANWSRGASMISAMGQAPGDTIGTFYPCLWGDQHGNCVPYRIETSGWLRGRDGAFGTVESRTFSFDPTTVQLGDTAGVRIYDRDGALITEGVAFRSEGYGTPLQGDPFLTWSVEIYSRTGYPHRPNRGY